MARFKLVENAYPDIVAVSNLVNYCLLPNKIPTHYFGAYAANPNTFVSDIHHIKKLYCKEHGNQVRHFIVSFVCGSTTPTLAFQMAWKIAEFLGQQFQVFFAVHEDRPNLHVHFVFNTISFRDGHTYKSNYQDFFELKNLSEQIDQV